MAADCRRAQIDPAPGDRAAFTPERADLFNLLAQDARGELYAQQRPDLALLLFETALLLYPREEKIIIVIRELISTYTRLGFRDRAHALAQEFAGMLARQLEPTESKARLAWLDFRIRAGETRAYLAAELHGLAAGLQAQQEIVPLIDELYAGRRANLSEIDRRARVDEQSGHLYREAGQWRQALRRYNRARRRLRPLKQGVTRAAKLSDLTHNAAQALLHGGRHPATVLAVMEKLIAAAAEVTTGWLLTQAQALADLGRTDKAMALAADVLAAVEERRLKMRGSAVETGVSETLHGAYDLAVRLTALKGDPAAVLEIINHAKARVFSRRLTADDSTYAPAAEQAEDAEFNERTARYAANLNAAEDMLRADNNRDALRQLQLVRHNLAEALATRHTRQAPRLALSALQAALPAGTLALEFYQLEKELVLVAVTGTSAQVHRTPLTLNDADDYAVGVASMVRQLHATPHVSPAQNELLYWTTGKLYECIFSPLRELLAGHTTLVLCPHRATHRIPFALLRDSAGQLLGETHCLSYTPSLPALLRERPAAARGTVTALVLANCSGELLHAENEGRAVAALFAGAQLFTGNAATLAQVQRHIAAADVIHIACHNRFDPHGIVHTHIPLADAPLTNDAVFRCSLSRAPLVVLSACDSGLAQERKSDELDSFAHAFILAGARAVVATLWPIDDAGTAPLMLEFYRAWRDCRDASCALATMQRAARQRGVPPHLFGAFKVMR